MDRQQASSLTATKSPHKRNKSQDAWQKNGKNDAPDLERSKVSKKYEHLNLDASSIVTSEI